MGGYFTNGSNWLQLRPPRIVYRISYVVYRDKRNKEKRTWDSKPSQAPPVEEEWAQRMTARPAGFGGRVKRWRRRSPSPSATNSYLVVRISYIARKEIKTKEQGARSQSEHRDTLFVCQCERKRRNLLFMCHCEAKPKQSRFRDKTFTRLFPHFFQKRGNKWTQRN